MKKGRNKYRKRKGAYNGFSKNSDVSKSLLTTGQYFFNHPGIMFMFQKMYPLRQGFSGIVFKDVTCCLEYRVAVIIVFINIVNGDATFLLLCSNYCFMNLVTKHSFAAILWQQRRVDVDDLIGIRID